MALPKIQHPFRWTLLAAACALVGFGHWMWQNHRLNQAVADEVARIDQLDPDWTYEAIEAKRPVIADKDNGALLVLEIAAKIPKNWPEWENYNPIGEPEDQTEEEKRKLRLQAELRSVEERDPRVRLSSGSLAWLRAELEKANEALTLALKLPKFSQGRFPVNHQLFWFQTSRPDFEVTSQVQILLVHQARFQLQQAQFQEAYQTALQLISLSRSIGDDDDYLMQVRRTSSFLNAQEAVEGCLMVAEMEQEILRQIQELLESEARDTGVLLYHAFRARRALTHRMMEALWERRIRLQDIGDKNWQPKFGLWSLRSQHAAFLGETTDALESWKKDWVPVMAKKTVGGLRCGHGRDGGDWYKNFVEFEGHSKYTQVRLEARLRTAYVALAAERFRLENKRWPHTLEELTPRFIQEVPLDPYTKTSLRLARRAGELVIYSVGLDGQDHGGAIQRDNPQADGSDLGFTLLDPDKRGLLPAK